VGDRAVFFDSGRIVDDGAVDDVIARHNWAG
jgi:hypothetical protein